MVIAIENNLQMLKAYLGQHTDYTLYTLGNHEGAVDVVIYDTQYTEDDFNNYQYESIQQAVAKISDISYGTLIIHVEKQTPEQILEILKSYEEKRY